MVVQTAWMSRKAAFTHPTDGHRRLVSDDINTATRESHDRLNKLITTYLPQALPPFCDTPTLYYCGISDFGLVYEAFESCWETAISQDTDVASSSSPRIEPRVRNYLRYLFSPELLRGHRIKADIQQYKECQASIGRTLPQDLNSKVLHKYLRHIQARISSKPHVVVAYAWIMYMALFSGGRWMRKQLANGGKDFWIGFSPETTSSQSKLSVEDFLSVLHFDGYEDGEDIKRDFRQRIAEIDPLLTKSERADIIAEGVQIFNSTVLLVQDLHRRYGNVVDSSVSKRYSILFTQPTHYTYTFWKGILMDPSKFLAWLYRAWIELLLDLSIIDIDTLARREINVVQKSTKRPVSGSSMTSRFTYLFLVVQATLLGLYFWDDLSKLALPIVFTNYKST